MCVSAIGTWMQNTAQPWFAYTLTNSALLLSLVSALQFVPVLLLSLLAGVLIDRLPKKKVLVATQSCSMLIKLSLALLVWSGKIQYWHLLISASLLVAALSKNGLRRFNLFDVPVLTGIALAAIGLTSTFAATCLALVAGGFLFVSYTASANSNMQIHTGDCYRRRVMSVYTFISAGSMPVGNLFVGSMDNWFGARAGFLASGAAIVLLMIPLYIYLYHRWETI